MLFTLSLSGEHEQHCVMASFTYSDGSTISTHIIDLYVHNKNLIKTPDTVRIY